MAGKYRPVRGGGQGRWHDFCCDGGCPVRPGFGEGPDCNGSCRAARGLSACTSSGAPVLSRTGANGGRKIRPGTASWFLPGVVLAGKENRNGSFLTRIGRRGRRIMHSEVRWEEKKLNNGGRVPAARERIPHGGSGSGGAAEGAPGQAGGRGAEGLRAAGHSAGNGLPGSQCHAGGTGGARQASEGRADRHEVGGAEPAEGTRESQGRYPRGGL